MVCDPRSLKLLPKSCKQTFYHQKKTHLKKINGKIKWKSFFKLKPRPWIGPPNERVRNPKKCNVPSKENDFQLFLCFCFWSFLSWGKIAIVAFPTCSLGGPSRDWVPFFSWFTFVIFSIWIWVCFWFVCFFYLFFLWYNFSANIEIHGIATVQKSSLNLCLQGFGPPIAFSAIPDINVQGKSWEIYRYTIFELTPSTQQPLQKKCDK